MADAGGGARARARRSAFRPVDLLFVLVCALLFVPFLGAYDFLDPDAQALVGAWRESGGILRWHNHLPALTLASWVFNGLLNTGGLVHDDYMHAYRLAIWLAGVGVSTLAYVLILFLTRRRVAAFAFGLIVATLPAVVDHAVVGEDNLFASLMHMIYVLVYVLNTVAWRRGEERRPERRLPVLLLPVALVGAMAGHRQLNVLWLTPLALPWLAGRARDHRLIRLVAFQLAFAAVLQLLLFSAALRLWHGTWSPRLLADYLREWYIPNAFYRDFYVDRQFGQNWIMQIGAVQEGLRRLISHWPLRGRSLGWWYLALFLLLILPFLTGRGRPRRVWGAFLVLVAVQVPHSLIYESANPERWDAIAPPLGVLTAVLAVHAHRRVRWRGIGAGWLVAPLVLAIGWCNALWYMEIVRGIRVYHNRPEVRARIEPLLNSVRSAPDPQGRRDVLVVTVEEYDKNPMLPIAYFSWRDAIFLMRADGVCSQPGRLFPTPDTFREMHHEQLLREVEFARVHGSPAALDRLEAFRTDRLAPHIEVQGGTIPVTAGTAFQRGGAPWLGLEPGGGDQD